MTPAIAHRIPRPLSVLTALAVLTLSAPLALLGTPGHAAPMDDDSSTPGLKITSDIVIKSDDTYSVKAVMTDNSGFGIFSEDNCKVDDFSQTKFGKNSKNAKATFKEDGDSTICTIEGSASIKDSDGTIKHQGSEYVVKIGTDEAIGDMDQLDVTQSITFPGKVTEADGGKVNGNKVTFTDIKSHTVKGGDGSIPMWVWIIVGVGALALVGGLAAFLPRATYFDFSLFIGITIASWPFGCLPASVTAGLAAARTDIQHRLHTLDMGQQRQAVQKMMDNHFFFVAQGGEVVGLVPLFEQTGIGEQQGLLFCG